MGYSSFSAPFRAKCTNKYNAKKITVDNITFHSKKEMARYCQLKIMLQTGLIKDLRLQIKYPVYISGKKMFTYIADFVYVSTDTGETIVEDVKGYRTDVYKLKKKIVEAVFNISIKEI